MEFWAWTLGALAAAGVSARYNWWRPSRPGVPILMYHHVGPAPNGTGLPQLWVEPERFARQLDLLAAGGWRTLTLSQALAEPRARRAVVLTFDDGYADFHEQAWPLIRERGMTATVFLVTGRLDGMNEWDREKSEPQVPLLGREQVLELSAAGVEFGGHGHRHADLTGLDRRGLVHEVTGCQKALTDLLGRPARTFSYAYGKLSPAARDAVAGAGFTAACTTRPGKLAPGADPLELPRIIVKRRDDGLDFRLKLSRCRSTF